ncbi:MAG: 16S rRNA methyltransferase [Candidatus Bathyarchaeia archaeon]
MSALTIIFAESSIELVEEKLAKHPQIVKYARKRGKNPTEIILDKNYHYQAIKDEYLKSKNKEKHAFERYLKTGRPDIVHFALLSVLETPLNFEGMLKVYVHTLNDYVIDVNPKTRLPKNYNRFIGLIEQLYAIKKVPLKGEALLILYKMTLEDLIKRISPSKIFALSRLGKPKTLEEACKEMSALNKPLALIGGFPHGHFSKRIINISDEIIKIDNEGLNTWTVASRLVYEFERSIGLLKKRIKE